MYKRQVKTVNGYDFYGGISKGIEKHTRVKSRIIATALLELIDTSENVIVMGHRASDLDAVGSSIALAQAIRRMEMGIRDRLDGVDMKVTGTVPAGRVFVDGYGVGDVGSIVLRDRKHLAQDGLIIVVVTMESTSGAVVAGPDIVSRGFVYVRESEELMDNARQRIVEVLDDCASRSVREWGTIKTAIKDDLSNFIDVYKRQTKRVTTTRTRAMEAIIVPLRL